jgi:hypothetical protein
MELPPKIGAAHAWAYTQGRAMDEATYRSRDLVLKVVAGLLAAIGAGFGLYEYVDGVQRESKRPYWERQVALYFDATSAAATLATSGDEPERKKAAAEFWRLYWGPLAVVEDPQVEAAMVEFAKCIDKPCPQDQLQRLSLALAHTCRNSLRTSWKLTFEELKGKLDRMKSTEGSS